MCFCSFQYAPNIADDGNIAKLQPLGEIIHNSVRGHHRNHRFKRSLMGNTCQMYLVADTNFYNGIGNNDVNYTLTIMVCTVQLDWEKVDKF